MEDVVAVRLDFAEGSERYLLTWGRIQDAIDPQPLESVVLRACHRFALPAEPIAARLCRSLREAAGSDRAPYFFEHWLWFAWHPIPFGPGYQDWRSEREAAMDLGREIFFCGNP